MLRWHRDAWQIVLPLAAPIRLSGGEISKLINGFVRALETSEFEAVIEGSGPRHDIVTADWLIIYRRSKQPS
jgi:hypothetical protein